MSGWCSLQQCRVQGLGITRICRVGGRGSPILCPLLSLGVSSSLRLCPSALGVCSLCAKAGWHQGGMQPEQGSVLAREELDLLQISRVRKSPQVTLQLQTNARLQGPPMIQPGETSALPPCSRPLSI